MNNIYDLILYLENNGQCIFNIKSFLNTIQDIKLTKYVSYNSKLITDEDYGKIYVKFTDNSHCIIYLDEIGNDNAIVHRIYKEGVRLYGF